MEPLTFMPSLTVILTFLKHPFAKKQINVIVWARFFFSFTDFEKIIYGFILFSLYSCITLSPKHCSLTPERHTFARRTCKLMLCGATNETCKIHQLSAVPITVALLLLTSVQKLCTGSFVAYHVQEGQYFCPHNVIQLTRDYFYLWINTHLMFLFLYIHNYFVIILSSSAGEGWCV